MGPQQVGVGMRIQDDAPHKVISLVPMGAAARAGVICVGHLLMAIDSQSIESLSAVQICSMVVGDAGTAGVYFLCFERGFGISLCVYV